MAVNANLVRMIKVSAGADPDWAATQASPGGSALFDVAGVSSIVVAWRAYEADGTTLSSGTLDLQLVAVTTAPAVRGLSFGAIVVGAPVEAAVPLGAGVLLDVRGFASAAIRVADLSGLAVGAATIQIFAMGVE